MHFFHVGGTGSLLTFCLAWIPSQPQLLAGRGTSGVGASARRTISYFGLAWIFRGSVNGKKTAPSRRPTRQRFETDHGCGFRSG